VKSTHNTRGRSSAWLICALAAAAGGTADVACAQLNESQVLVLYDSRIPDSLSIAEFYAGSTRVPGGIGNRSGMHPTVRVADLAQMPGAGVVPNPGTISYPNFVSKFRDPLRTYLAATNLTNTIRCIVLTRGLPHRVQDINHPNPNVGDQPGSAASLLNAGNATYASLDSELTFLWQNLNAGEANGLGDSKADGGIINPYFKSVQPMSAYSTQNIRANKTILQGAPFNGIIWRWFPTNATGLTGGDMYLVCRLDGNSVADVIASVERSHNLAIDLDTSLMILDESASDGVQNTSDSDNELDNDGPVQYTNNGDDYEQTRDLLISDGRFLASNIKYDRWATASGFLVGPLLNFGGGTVVNGKVLLLATYGANHSGVPGTPGSSGTQYPFSFTYHPGAVFNTIESYNGRSFGGIGIGPIPQAQVADFLQAGGTFGIGNVWEPFSFSVPDNVLIVRNFYLGSLTWAEAAWSSIPMVSWQQVVVGDPLARVRRTREDINGDEGTDLEDLYSWFAPASRPRDLNRDGRVDRVDAETLRNSIRGPESGNMRPVGGR